MMVSDKVRFAGERRTDRGFPSKSCRARTKDSMTITLIVTDENGAEALRVEGPKLPVSSVCKSGYATPSPVLAVAAFARMFGRFIENPEPQGKS
jgi:hypothetical protein